MGEIREKNTESGKVKRQKNLIPFVKGKSGNPKGHPKGQLNYATIYRMALLKLGKENNKTPSQIEMEMVANGVRLGRGGDYKFYKDVLDRIHGTPIQRNDMTSGGKPIPLLNVLQNEIKDIDQNDDE